MKSFGISNKGLVRKTNEDKFYINEDSSLFMVADGMGGHVAGELASDLAVREILKYMQDITEEESSWINEVTLKEAVQAANQSIRQEISANPDLQGMGTTAVLVYIEQKMLFWAHVGDSRLYTYYRGNLKQITNDHSLVSKLVQDGKITEEQASSHPSRNVITRSVGTVDELEVDTGRINLEPETMILLCSDGLTGMVSDEDIRLTMIDHENNPQEVAEALMKKVYQAGATDNVTVLVVAV